MSFALLDRNQRSDESEMLDSFCSCFKFVVCCVSLLIGCPAKKFPLLVLIKIKWAGMIFLPIHKL